MDAHEGTSADRTGALAAIAADPRYRAVVAARMRFALILTAIVLFVFFGYILLVAFGREVLAQPIGGGSITLGIPVGLGVILSGIVLTAIYVRRANRVFDPAIAALRAEHGA